MIDLYAITEVVAKEHGLAKSTLLAYDRRRRIAHARQEAMFLARDLTDLSYNEIGRYFGRDHTTVMHAVAAVRERIAADPAVAQRRIDMTLSIVVNEQAVFVRGTKAPAFKSVRRLGVGIRQVRPALYEASKYGRGISIFEKRGRISFWGLDP